MRFFFCFRFFIRFDDLTRNAWRASCASSKHLQTRRFLHTLQGYLCDIQRLLIQLHRSANERPAPFVDHTGILRDSKTGRPINGYTSNEVSDEEEITMREFRPCTDQLYCGWLTSKYAWLQRDILSSIVVTSNYWEVERSRRIPMLVSALNHVIFVFSYWIVFFSGKVIQMAEYWNKVVYGAEHRLYLYILAVIWRSLLPRFWVCNAASFTFTHQKITTSLWFYSLLKSSG